MRVLSTTPLSKKGNGGREIALTTTRSSLRFGVEELYLGTIAKVSAGTKADRRHRHRVPSTAENCRWLTLNMWTSTMTTSCNPCRKKDRLGQRPGISTLLLLRWPGLVMTRPGPPKEKINPPHLCQSIHRSKAKA